MQELKIGALVILVLLVITVLLTWGFHWDWQIVQLWQTAIVGVLGFCGVIWTMRENAKLAREQVDNQRKHDGKVIARALVSELSAASGNLGSSIEVAQEQIDSSKDGEVPSVYINFIPTPIFNANLDKLGLLEFEFLNKILLAYIEVNTYRQMQDILQTNSDLYSVKIESTEKIKAFIEDAKDRKKVLDKFLTDQSTASLLA